MAGLRLNPNYRKEQQSKLLFIVESLASPTSEETDYLLSTEANRQQLLEAIESANAPENLVVITPEEL